MTLPWLEGQFQKVVAELVTMFQHMSARSPQADRLLVGYPRLASRALSLALRQDPART
ncbi:hypothetical protein ACFY00_37430 [Kitasatospora sp. NPDC001540]|uniref:hypothetical protein n=1 Tax=Kitasatospora sp. NPDC001540 TaxID=3364014 RepID=UPI0036870149